MTISRRKAVVAALCALLLFAAGCKEKAPTEKPVRPVRVEAAAAVTPEGGLRYSATIQPHSQVALAWKLAGRVAAIAQRKGPDGKARAVQLGDRVRKGEELARLDAADVRARVEQAEAGVQEARAAAGKAAQDAERAVRLFADHSLTKPDLEAAQAGLAAARARLDGARAQVEAVRVSLHDTVLTAPMDAVVLSRVVEPGSLVAPGTPAFQIADLRQVKAVFGAPEAVATALRVGATLPVALDPPGSPPVAGRVSAVAPAADPASRVFTVELALDNPDLRLRPGVVVAVQVPTPANPPSPARPAQPSGAASVPLSAVVQPAAGASSPYAVFLYDGPAERGTARLRAVRLGDVVGSRVTVVDGLQVGDRVIVSGASLLTDGEPVLLLP
ncbi:MAG TPA: efflux RND transporter periplasmic adaptor subunit [Thermoanaerobaculia bacterium]